MFKIWPASVPPNFAIISTIFCPDSSSLSKLFKESTSRLSARISARRIISCESGIAASLSNSPPDPAAPKMSVAVLSSANFVFI